MCINDNELSVKFSSILLCYALDRFAPHSKGQRQQTEGSCAGPSIKTQVAGPQWVAEDREVHDMPPKRGHLQVLWNLTTE